MITLAMPDSTRLYLSSEADNKWQSMATPSCRMSL